MIRATTRTLCLFFVISLLSFSVHARSVTLTPKWEVGKRYEVQTSIEQITQMPMGPQTANMSNTSRIFSTISVFEGEQAGTKELVLDYGRMHMTIDSMGKVIHYDTMEPDPDNPMNFLKDMANASLTIIIDEDNNLIEIKDMDSLINSVGGNPMATQMIESMMGEELLESMIQCGLYDTPTKPIAVGESWGYDIEVPMGDLGSMTIIGDFELTDIRDYEGDECAIIKTTGLLKGEMNVGMPVDLEDSTVAGDIIFSLELGQAVKSTANQKMVMTMRNPQTEEDMTIEIEQSVEYKLIVVDDI